MLMESLATVFTLGEMLITVFIAPLCAYIWFTLFERNRMNDSRRINKIASTTFGVYLIHESIIGRPLFWYNILCVDTLQYESFFVSNLCIDIGSSCLCYVWTNGYMQRKIYTAFANEIVK
jgi:hypothetical protein